jgi:hypothetical protein
MSLPSRLRKLEANLGSEDRCAQCGYPSTAMRFVMLRDGQEMGTCQACGRTTTPDGHPLHGGYAKVLRRGRRRGEAPDAEENDR